MLGGVATARVATNKETKKLEADLNKASLDLQEKQAMYRTTGSMQDRAEAEKAQARYEGFLKDKETLSQRAQETKDNADYRNKSLTQAERLANAQLDQTAALHKQDNATRERIAEANANARAKAASAQLARMGAADQAKYRQAALKNFDEGKARKEIAKSFGWSKMPAPGVDPVADSKIEEALAQAKQKKVLDYVATVTGVDNALAYTGGMPADFGDGYTRAD
jgi:DNA repair exonuclease SbcCD ATPase subunit